MQTTFEEIDAQIATLSHKSDALAQAMAVYPAVRGLLATLADVPLLPPQWRAALGVFITSLDGVRASFKAGKDL